MLIHVCKNMVYVVSAQIYCADMA